MAATMKATHTIDGCPAVELFPRLLYVFLVGEHREHLVIRLMHTILKWEETLLEYDGDDHFIELTDAQLDEVALVVELFSDTWLAEEDTDTWLAQYANARPAPGKESESTPRLAGEGHSASSFETQAAHWSSVEQLSSHPSRETTKIKQELSVAVIEELKNKGLNQSEIAAMYGVTRQAISWHLKTYGSAPSTRQIVNEAWPWNTGHGHDKASPYRRRRGHGEFMRTGGKGMSDDKLKRLRTWWKKMREKDLVVEFDPTLPPIKGVAPHGGFAYLPRTVEDGDLLIRVNEYTTLTEDGEMLWCWPPAATD